jgi:hypothetical protein
MKSYRWGTAKELCTLRFIPPAYTMAALYPNTSAPTERGAWGSQPG